MILFYTAMAILGTAMVVGSVIILFGEDKTNYVHDWTDKT